MQVEVVLPLVDDPHTLTGVLILRGFKFDDASTIRQSVERDVTVIGVPNPRLFINLEFPLVPD